MLHFWAHLGKKIGVPAKLTPKGRGPQTTTKNLDHRVAGRNLENILSTFLGLNPFPTPFTVTRIGKYCLKLIQCCYEL